MILFCTLFVIFSVFCFYIVCRVELLKTHIEEIDEDLEVYEDLQTAYRKLYRIEECVLENSNGSMQNLVNKIKTILNEE